MLALKTTATSIDGYDESVIEDSEYIFNRQTGTYLYGIELEFNSKAGICSEDVAVNVVSAANKTQDYRLIAATDCSVTGFELNTIPATFDTHYKYLDVYDDLWDNVNVDSDYCGMHIHVDSLSVKPLQYVKWYYFLQKPENKPFIIHIAGRETDMWAKFPSDNTPLPVVAKNYPICTPLANRYCRTQGFVSWRPCYRTHEMRLFASPTNSDELIARLGFVETLFQVVDKWPLTCSFHYEDYISSLLDLDEKFSAIKRAALDFRYRT